MRKVIERVVYEELDGLTEEQWKIIYRQLLAMYLKKKEEES